MRRREWLCHTCALAAKTPGSYSRRHKKKTQQDLFFLWCHQESNRGHKDFQSFALPTELWHLAVSREKRVQKYCFFLIYANIFAFFCEKGSIFLFFSLILTTFAPEKSLNNHLYATTTSYCPCP